MTSQRPIPAPDERSDPFWSAAADHVLVLARCSRCGQLTHPPDIACPLCHHPDPAFSFEPVPGGGTVSSWVVLHQSFLPGFDALLPLVLVDVTLDVEPAVRLIGRLVGAPATSLAIGTRVSVTFEDLQPGVSVPAFALGRS